MNPEALGLIVLLVVVSLFMYRDLRDDGYVDMVLNKIRRRK